MDDNKKLQVNVDLTKFPELYKALMSMADERDTTPPRLVRRFIREGLDVEEHVNKIGAKFKPKIKDVAGLRDQR